MDVQHLGHSSYSTLSNLNYDFSFFQLCIVLLSLFRVFLHISYAKSILLPRSLEKRKSVEGNSGASSEENLCHFSLCVSAWILSWEFSFPYFIVIIYLFQIILQIFNTVMLTFWIFNCLLNINYENLSCRAVSWKKAMIFLNKVSHFVHVIE
jgi:hypothetical protein